MKIFIRKIVFLLIPLVILAYPLDIFLSNQLKKSIDYYGEFEVWNDIYQNNINTDIAVYGSSRAWVNISPKILKDSLHQNVYNFGLNGHTFYLQHLRHLEYFKHNKKPKHIVFAVDFNSFHKGEGLYLKQQFLPYMLWNKNIKDYTKPLKGFNKYDYNVPLVRYAGEKGALAESLKFGLLGKKQKTYRINGYKGKNKKWTTDYENAKKQMTAFPVSVSQESVQLFKTFLAQCKKNNIKVTLVYTPEFIEGQHFIKGREKVVNIYQSLAKKFDITFLDYSKNKICLNRDYFYNTTHLNKKGSILFSKTLAHDLLKLESITNKKSN